MRRVVGRVARRDGAQLSLSGPAAVSVSHLGASSAPGVRARSHIVLSPAHFCCESARVRVRRMRRTGRGVLQVCDSAGPLASAPNGVHWRAG